MQPQAQVTNLNPAVRQMMEERYGRHALAQGGLTILDLPYFSRVDFKADVAAGPPAVYTIGQTPRKAFAYAQGQDRAIAGAPGVTATAADTNILVASQTRDNADVIVYGAAACLLPNSDPALAAKVWEECDVEIAFNGTQQIPIGRLEMYPSAGGLFGVGQSAILEPSAYVPGGANGGQGATVGFLANGNPAAGNFYRFGQPFFWAATGSSGIDSTLILSVTPRRTITVEAAAARAEDVTIGVEPFDPPEAAAVSIMWHLKCVQVSRRSRNT